MSFCKFESNTDLIIEIALFEKYNFVYISALTFFINLYINTLSVYIPLSEKLRLLEIFIDFICFYADHYKYLN